MQTSTTATADIDPAAALQPPPKIIGRFTVVGEIGRGANGVVYAARDPVLGRDVAIKAIALAAKDKVRRRAEARFIREARAVAGLNHPHIVTVFDAGRTGSVAYIAMERLHGRDLHEFLRGGAPLGVRQTVALMARIADAVHYAHKRGLIHRDMKPSNIFLLRGLKPKVLDFGVALPRTDADASPGAKVVGTPNYMSPEQAQGRALDARSDVFSLGAILYEMVTGRRAFEAPDVDRVLQRLIDEEPERVERLRPEVPPELVRIIDKALAKDVEKRYQTAGELRNDLAALAGRRDLDDDPARLSPSRAEPRRRPAVWTAAVVAAAALLGTGLWLARPAASPPPTAASAGAAPASTIPPAAIGAQRDAPPLTTGIEVQAGQQQTPQHRF